jgi:hypothetical protein
MKKNKIYEDRVKWALSLLPLQGLAVGIEVGLWKADFAKQMLEARENLIWYGVDPYMEYGRKHRKQPAWDAICERVRKKMEPFGYHFVLVRRPSEKAFMYLPPEVDFVFIDGNHDEDFVYNDLQLYEPRLKEGGIMSGHDYNRPKPGVRNAVNRYVEENNRKLVVDTSFDESGVFWWKV